MSGRLSGRIAIITGAARGQGAATARLFAAEGARVVLADVLEDGAAVAAEIGADSAVFEKLDVTDEAAWTALVAKITACWGAPDILINNAGIVHVGTVTTLDKGDFERVLGINLIGAWLGIKTTAPGMIAKGKGAIVNICSTSGLWGMNGLTAYMTSKWALRGLTKNAAMELGHQGVRVNAVFPGGVNTVMGNVTDSDPAELNKQYVGQTIQRIGEPEEIAHASLFLASDEASYMAGAELAVDGGMTLGIFTPFLPGGPSA